MPCVDQGLRHEEQSSRTDDGEVIVQDAASPIFSPFSGAYLMDQMTYDAPTKMIFWTLIGCSLVAICALIAVTL